MQGYSASQDSKEHQLALPAVITLCHIYVHMIMLNVYPTGGRWAKKTSSCCAAWSRCSRTPSFAMVFCKCFVASPTGTTWLVTSDPSGPGQATYNSDCSSYKQPSATQAVDVKRPGQLCSGLMITASSKISLTQAMRGVAGTFKRSSVISKARCQLHIQ